MRFKISISRILLSTIYNITHFWQFLQSCAFVARLLVLLRQRKYPVVYWPSMTKRFRRHTMGCFFIGCFPLPVGTCFYHNHHYAATVAIILIVLLFSQTFKGKRSRHGCRVLINSATRSILRMACYTVQ